MHPRQFTYVTKSNSVTVYIDSMPYTASSTHINYDRIMLAVKKGILHQQSEADLKSLFDTTETVKLFLNNTIRITESGHLFYNNVRLENVLVTKILRMLKEGFDIEPMLNFLINLEKNPINAARKELMLFMEANDMPITPDGHLLAYKAVRDDYKDVYSGKFDNSIGQVCSMPRDKVDANRDRTCSSGLHFAAKEYAGSFGGRDSRLMVLKISPEDVVSIPSDYNNQKGRCCRYKVIGEVPKSTDGTDRYNQISVLGVEDE